VSVSDRSDAGNGALGNLFHPLSTLQVLGVWPAGDFRGRPDRMLLTLLLLAVVLAGGAYAVVVALRRRRFGLPLYALVSVGGCVLVLLLDAAGHGSAWLDAKALATASPTAVVAALAGAAVLFERGRRVLAVAAGVTVAGGVLWSNALAYGDVWLAPRAQLAELESIGKRFAGDGPSLMTEYQPYGVRHFLRRLDAEGASERRMRPVTLRTGSVLEKGQYADLDAFDPAALAVYPTLVLRTSPLESRPPSTYAPVWTGRWYEVWRRSIGAARVLEHLPLGTGTAPASVPKCADVRRLGAVAAQAGGRLVAAERPQPQLADLGESERPEDWVAGPGGTLIPTGTGSLRRTFSVPHGGRYGFWVGGSFRDRVSLLVDGRPVGSARHQLQSAAQSTPLGSARLASGTHMVELRDDGPGLRPGSRGDSFVLGPLAIGVPAADARLVTVAPAAAGALCGRSLDWVEAVAP
jgi:hypothetical protein